MKKILKLILIVAISLIGVTEVSAYKPSSGQSINREGICIGCFHDAGVTRNEFRTITYKMNYKGKDYHAYCLDTNKSDGADLVLEKEIESNTTNPYYRGLFAISSEVSKRKLNENDANTYEAINMAYRMLKYAVASPKASLQAGAGDNRLKYVSLVTAETLNANRSLANKALKAADKSFKNCKSTKCFYNGILNGYSYDSDKDVKQGSIPKIKLAKELFVEGLKGAAGESSYLAINNSKATSTIKNSVLKGEEQKNTNETLGKKIYVDINVTDFKSENVLKDLVLTEVSKPAGAVVKITGYSLNKGESFETVNGTIKNSILDDLTGNSTIVIEITITTPRSGYNCNDITFKLDYKYTKNSTDGNDGKVLLFKPIGANNTDQDFFVPTKYQDYTAGTPGNGPELIDESNGDEFTINFCDENKCIAKDPEKMSDEEKAACCDDWDNACESNNSSIYCTYVGDYCGTCDTKIDHPTACTDYDDAGISSGEMTEALDDDLTTDNTKFCLLMRKKDEAGNSYKAFENNYCEVYCKEKFDYKLPGAVTLNSGTYFQLEATITGTKSCYTSKIDVNKFKEDIDKLNSKYSSYNSEYNREYTDIVDQFNACVGLDETYSCFDPKIKYDYAEKYDDTISETNKEFNKYKEEVSEDKTEHCTGEVDKGYNCQGTKSTGTISVSKKTSSGSETKTYQTADYVKTTITKKGYYKTPSVFYSKEQSGTIVSKEEFDKLAVADKEKYAAVDGLPVSIKTERGDHQFKLTLSNVGQFYDQTGCKNGRLIGASNSVFNKKNSTSAEYNCKYVVNCPECEFDCEGPLCEIDHCDGPDCKVTCLGNGCAYSEAGLSYAYRTVSLTNFNPTGRTLGYNWDTDTSKNKAAVKAEAALEEITNNGEGVYEKEPLYTFKITPALQTKIKEHNKSKLDKGGYADESLVCEDYTYDGKTYKNVNCKSTFIEGLDSGEFGSNVTVPSSRNRFVSWFESDYCQTHVCTTKKGMGPSYK